MLSVSNFFTAMGDPPDAAKHHAAQWNEVWDAGEYAISEDRKRVAGHVGAIAEFLEGNTRQQQDRSSADFVQTVDVVDIVSRIITEALLRFSNEFVSFAKLRSAGWTRFRTRGRLTSLHAVRTHRALLHFGKQLAPFVLGNAKRTGDHAIAASHATAFFVNDGAFRGFPQGGYGTN